MTSVNPIFIYITITKKLLALGKLFGKFVYFAVKICHQFTLPSATPSFQFGKILENRQKHQRRRSAWVGQADFGELELNNRNHGGNFQRLSMKRDRFATQYNYVNKRWEF